MRALGVVAIAITLHTPAAHAQTGAAPAGEWQAYGRDVQGSRFSPLTQITRQNVARLRLAWTYRTGENQTATRREPKFEATPLMVDGTLYLSTPLGRVIALDPTTGRERWVFQTTVEVRGGWGDFANRGVSTWLDPRARTAARCRRRIYLGTIDARIIALDARTGKLCLDFGDSGVVNLRRGLRNAPFELAEYELTSPPVVVNGLLVAGSAVADNNRINAASGEVRAFDARTGQLRWTWDPVPRDSTDAAWSTWTGPNAHATGAANAWSVLAADPARDLVFVPTGSPSPDYFGGERLGDNRYANSIVALRASTGKVVWHFQAVHHDLWDYDVASPPLLATVSRNGRQIAAVLQTTKTGELFVLDRATGTPIFPVAERAVPASTVDGERASATQPFNTVIPPLSRHTFSPADIWGPTPADSSACAAQIQPLRNEGIFTPPSYEGTLVVPSNVGGAHWGGLAFDPSRQIAVVPVNTIASMVQLIPADRHDTAQARQNASRLGDEYTRMRGTPFVMRRRILLSPSGLPCTKPPFGTLVAIDLRSGAKRWEVPLGDLSPITPGQRARRAPSGSGTPLGSVNLGGPIVTAGGVVFVAATLDRAIRAFDVETGRVLWEAALPASARATPMTYQVTSRGKQYVVISVGGGEEFGRDDRVMAFALP